MAAPSMLPTAGSTLHRAWRSPDNVRGCSSSSGASSGFYGVRYHMNATRRRRRSLVVVACVGAPIQDVQDREQARTERWRQSLLEYEALKKNLSTTTIAVAGAIDAYTFLTLSPQSALSYGIGALGSYLYLQLLYRHADAVSADNVAEIFQRRKVKKIGIRSSDVQESLEKVLRGCSISLSSPRLFIPVGLYSLWAFSTHYTGTSSDTFHLEVAPIMFGFFAYKIAALIQAYQDNKDLLLVISTGDQDN